MANNRQILIDKLKIGGPLLRRLSEHFDRISSEFLSTLHESTITGHLKKKIDAFQKMVIKIDAKDLDAEKKSTQKDTLTKIYFNPKSINAANNRSIKSAKITKITSSVGDAASASELESGEEESVKCDSTEIPDDYLYKIKHEGKTYCYDIRMFKFNFDFDPIDTEKSQPKVTFNTSKVQTIPAEEKEEDTEIEISAADISMIKKQILKVVNHQRKINDYSASGRGENILGIERPSTLTLRTVKDIDTKQGQISVSRRVWDDFVLKVDGNGHVPANEIGYIVTLGDIRKKMYLLPQMYVGYLEPSGKLKDNEISLPKSFNATWIYDGAEVTLSTKRMPAVKSIYVSPTGIILKLKPGVFELEDLSTLLTTANPVGIYGIGNSFKLPFYGEQEILDIFKIETDAGFVPYGKVSCRDCEVNLIIHDRDSHVVENVSDKFIDDIRFKFLKESGDVVRSSALEETSPEVVSSVLHEHNIEMFSKLAVMFNTEYQKSGTVTDLAKMVNEAGPNIHLVFDGDVNEAVSVLKCLKSKIVSRGKTLADLTGEIVRDFKGSSEYFAEKNISIDFIGAVALAESNATLSKEISPFSLFLKNCARLEDYVIELGAYAGNSDNFDPIDIQITKLNSSEIKALWEALKTEIVADSPTDQESDYEYQDD